MNQHTWSIKRALLQLPMQKNAGKASAIKKLVTGTKKVIKPPVKPAGPPLSPTSSAIEAEGFQVGPSTRVGKAEGLYLGRPVRVDKAEGFQVGPSTRVGKAEGLQVGPPTRVGKAAPNLRPPSSSRFDAKSLIPDARDLLVGGAALTGGLGGGYLLGRNPPMAEQRRVQQIQAPPKYEAPVSQQAQAPQAPEEDAKFWDEQLKAMYELYRNRMNQTPSIPDGSLESEQVPEVVNRWADR